MKTFAHLIEKYSVYGYARYGRLYSAMYKEALSDMWIEIENIINKPEKLLQYLK